ncbi:MAG: hypothetical protein WCO09_04095, partial [bacterium]
LLKVQILITLALNKIMIKIIKNNLLRILTALKIRHVYAIIATLILSSPLVVFAETTNPVSEILLKCTKSETPCGYDDFIALINGIIKYGITIIGLAFVLVLLYVGFQYLTSGGDVGKVKKSRDMLNKVMWGLLYTLCGWLIVYFILTKLEVGKDFYNKVLTI